MAGYNKGKSAGPNSEDRALNLFADMMIEKIESFTGDWQKPWFTGKNLQWPMNMSGREYNGMNALMLMLHCEEKGYSLPRFCTFDYLQRMNKEKGDGQESLKIHKGEKSFPVMLTTFTCIHTDTKEKIKWDDYKNLSEDDKKKYMVFPKWKVYNVFNVAQTNMQEARPDLWEKLTKENGTAQQPRKGDDFNFEPLDTMIRDNLWLCPINPRKQDRAFYSVTKDEIIVPEKEQFKNGQAFYGTLLHEMTHSTGAEKHLNRFKPSDGFGSEEYAREELVAELSSALISQRYGIDKNLKEDSVAYLKSWLDALKESPQFIKTTLMDVKKASAIITQNIDKVARTLEQENGERQDNTQRADVAHPAPKEKIFYSSIAYLQGDDRISMERLMDNGDYKLMLEEATEYYFGDDLDLEETFTSAEKYKGDSLLDENDHFAVVYNNSVGGTFEIKLKVTEQELRDNIARNGVGNASKDVMEVAKDMVLEEYQKMVKGREPILEMPNGEYFYVWYNRNEDTIDVGNAVNAGLVPMHSFPYNHDTKIESNLTSVYEELSQMEQYQEEKVEEEYRGGMRR